MDPLIYCILIITCILFSVVCFCVSLKLRLVLALIFASIFMIIGYILFINYELQVNEETEMLKSMRVDKALKFVSEVVVETDVIFMEDNSDSIIVKANKELYKVGFDKSNNIDYITLESVYVYDNKIEVNASEKYEVEKPIKKESLFIL